jgi:hypothetical protein
MARSRDFAALRVSSAVIDRACRDLRHIGFSANLEQTPAVSISGYDIETENFVMPYTRPIRRFYLTPPAIPTFVISVLLAVLALLAVYGHFPQLHSIGGFTILLIAYVVLLLGTLLRGV